MDMKKYLHLFLSEASEHLQEAAGAAAELRGAKGSEEAVHALFRHFHSIKGMAASMGFEEIGSLSHAAEDFFDRLRRSRRRPTPEEIDLIVEAIDALSELVSAQEGGVSSPDVSPIAERLRSALPRTGLTVDGPPGTGRPAQAAPPAARTPGPPSAGTGAPATVRVAVSALDALLNSISDLMARRGKLSEALRSCEPQAARNALRDLSKSVDELRAEIMVIRMLPFDHIVPRLTRMVRDLCRRTGKRVTLQVSGSQVSMDRAVLEEALDPVCHLLRNAVDHGVEAPEERERRGKPRSGNLSIDVSRSGDRIIIVVQDDGGGMDLEAIKTAAVAGGYATREEAEMMDIHRLLLLTTLPGFSTAATVTEVSGRGVGMDVVRTRVEALGGHLSVDSTRGEGTRVEMVLPLTVAVSDAFLVTSGAEIFAVPAAGITGIRPAGSGFTPPPEPVTLDRALGTDPPSAGVATALLLFEVHDRAGALVVDRILERRQVVVKPLGAPLERLREFSGAALLDNGQVALILDLASLGAPGG